MSKITDDGLTRSTKDAL